MKRGLSEWRMKRHLYPSGREVIQAYLVIGDEIACRIESEDTVGFLSSATWKNGTMRKMRTLHDAKVAALELLREKTMARMECITLKRIELALDLQSRLATGVAE